MVIVCEDVETHLKNGTVKNGMYMHSTLKKNIDFLGEAIKQKWDGVIIVSGMEGCLSGGTKIRTGIGNIALNQIKGSFTKVVALDFKTKKPVVTTARVIKTGIKKTYKITTVTGKVIEATEDHTFFVNRNDYILEVRLSDIKQGDKLICQK